ncbi:LOW QUALITY PROTEIN: torso-like protein [Chelonus insularis]|uniref:LOW QUALITY PROTEIN: torso-like protein n=1 Tax=Chelonus insularis TaxID=460826 RepID=UPI00158A2541|nr:LOW QUALITY PROTEIN: torso-like protein [Chelonus insularis]
MLQEMWKRVRFLLLVAALIINIQIAQTQLKLGIAINIFERYGYLSTSMRVVPRNDSAPWIFREPSIDIVHDIKPESPLEENKSAVFDGDFHMEFCDNLRQLLQAYFRDFAFERFDRPWRAFTGGWSSGTIARHLGINKSFVTGQYCYVLIRVSRFRENQKMPETSDTSIFDNLIINEADNVTIGDEASVVQFIKRFGSHYVASFITGNSLYQVFVYTPAVYQRIKNRLKSRGVADLSGLELSNYFSPWYSDHVGFIKSASGNSTAESWATNNLRVQYYFFTYPSLLKLHGDTELLYKLNSLLENEAILQLQLRTLAPLFMDPSRRDWFLEVIDNYIKLWEVNL